MNNYLDLCATTAREAGEVLMKQFGAPHEVNEFHAHDIKLALDVETQELIESRILEAFPEHSILGEEGNRGDANSEYRWVIDPIDGTVNFFYGIPHFCISIALQRNEKTIAGVIFDPTRNELWEAADGVPTRLNGRETRVSPRTQLCDAVLSVGLAKSKASIGMGFSYMEKYVKKARKCRLMGSAALDLAYVACGRLDAYIESSVSLWDVAAGQILVENAGGVFTMTPHPDESGKISVRAWNGTLDLEVES
jgi:myo-inositol-1(or 4)-monophosphatase